MESSIKPEIRSIIYSINGREYVGKIIGVKKQTELGLSDDCNCGDELCIGGWVYRCMAGGSGECVWYETGEVC